MGREGERRGSDDTQPGGDTERRRGFEDDGDQGRWTKEVARLLARISRYTHLEGTPWERHSGQTDIDIETRLPTICNIYLNV